MKCSRKAEKPIIKAECLLVNILQWNIYLFFFSAFCVAEISDDFMLNIGTARQIALSRREI